MNSNFKYLIGLTLGIAILGSVWYFRTIVAYILVAAAVSIIGQPLVRKITKIKLGRFSIPQGVAAALTLTAMWILFFGFFRIFIPLIISEANELSKIDASRLYQQFGTSLQSIENTIKTANLFNSETSFEQYMIEKIQSVLNISHLSNIFSSLTGMLGNLFIAFFAISFISFFFLKDSSLFTKGLYAFIPDKYLDETSNIITSARKLLTRYLGGIIIEVLLVLILVTIGLWAVGIGFRHALVCGLFSGIMNVIPYVGPWIGALFSVVIGIATNIGPDMQTQILPLTGYMLAVFLVVQTLDNILFQPLIYSNSVNAHPLEIFIIIMMAGSIAGIPGMVLAIPGYTVIRVIAKEFLSRYKLVRKLTRNI